MVGLEFSLDYGRYRQRLKNLYQRAIPWFKDTFRDMATKAYTDIKEATPETSPGRTEIRDLWRMEHTTSGMVETFIIKNLYQDEKVLIFFEKGTKPHIIRPVNAKFLHFFIEDTGEEIFTKLVHHPGTPAYKMVEPAKEELNEKADFYIQNFFQNLDRLMNEGVK